VRAAKEAKKAAQIAARIAAGPPAAVIRNEAEARAVMAKILVAHPTLTPNGLGLYDGEKLSREEYSARSKQSGGGC
jgi:hypothetical protein